MFEGTRTYYLVAALRNIEWLSKGVIRIHHFVKSLRTPATHDMQAKVLRTVWANGIPQATTKQPPQRVDEETPIV